MKKERLQQEINRLNHSVLTHTAVINGKDDTIHNLRRALYKRDMSIDQQRAEISNLQDKNAKLHNHPQEETPMSYMNALSQEMDEAGVPQAVRNDLMKAIALGKTLREAMDKAGHGEATISISGKTTVPVPAHEQDEPPLHDFCVDPDEEWIDALLEETTESTPQSNEVLFDLIRADFNDHPIEYRVRYGNTLKSEWMSKRHDFWDTYRNEYRLAQ